MKVELRNGLAFTLHAGNSDINSITEIFGTKSFTDFMSLIKPNDLFLDIGANIGIVSRYAQSRGARVIAYEPNPAIIPLLRKNFNGEIHEEAVCGTKGARMFTADETGWGGASMAYQHGNTSFEAEGVSIGDIVKQFPSVEFMKMDIEGGEKEVLNALTPENASRIKHLLVDVHPPMMEIADADVILKRLGFRTNISKEFYCIVAER